MSSMLGVTAQPRGGAPKIGAFGLGGIGKTQGVACIARDEDVRAHFDKVAWVTLGQTPQLDKCLQLVFLQLTGKQMKDGQSMEQSREVLTQVPRATAVVPVLLCDAARAERPGVRAGDAGAERAAGHRRRVGPAP
jgi:hypothetical protein